MGKLIKENTYVWLIILLIIIPAASARSVTMNAAFNISGKDNIIHVNGTDYNATQNNAATFTNLDKKFISSEKNSKVFAIVFAGSQFLDAYFNTTYSANEYLLAMSQDDYNNRFLIAFTNGTYSNIDSKAKDVEGFHMLSKLFGDLAFSVPNSFSFFLRLEYSDVDLYGRKRFDGPTKLLVKNSGKVGSIYNITLDVI
jgi:hypothetical protein